MTPLILATKRKDEQMLNVLIHAGVDVDAESKDVICLCTNMCMHFLLCIIAVPYMHLVESSPYTRHIQDEQMTALMFAVKVGSFDVVKMLAEHSASVFILDSVSTSCCIM